MTQRRAPIALAFLFTASLAVPAFAQQGQGEWFVPGGQQRPAQGQQQQQPRPQQQRPQQRPAQAPAALPPGQQPPAAVVGIVDIPEVQNASTAFRTVREEFERRRQRLNEDLQREQNSWREQQQQLANQRASLPPDQLRERERALQERITDSQRIFRERSRGMDQVAQQALIEIEQALGAVIRQVAASRKVNLVLPRQMVIFNEPPFDLTEEVSQQFNRVLRTVNIPPEQTGAASPPAGAGGGAAPTSRPAQGQQGQGQRR